MALPNPGMIIDPERTALVLTDPQNDFLSPDGVMWGVVGESVTENNTVANLEALLKAAKENDIQVFISPHYGDRAASTMTRCQLHPNRV